MKSLKALIIDDEAPARDSLRHIIENNCPEIQISGMAHSAAEARGILAGTQIDVLFIDVSMPNEGGFEFLESIDSSRYMFVFVTAYDQYALQALRASAVDYLQKPIDTAELMLAVEKLERLQSERSLSLITNDNYSMAINSLLFNTRGGNGVHRLCLPSMQGFTVVEVDNILALEADNNYTIFNLTNMKKIVVSKSIKDYEDILDPSSFVRIHKSSIINLKYLKEFSKADGNNAIMIDDSSIAISRRRLPDFMKAVEDYNFHPAALYKSIA